jgi:hypothetical protein
VTAKILKSTIACRERIRYVATEITNMDAGVSPEVWRAPLRTWARVSSEAAAIRAFRRADRFSKLLTDISQN